MAKDIRPTPADWEAQKKRVQEYLRDHPDYYKQSEPPEKSRSEYSLDEPENEAEDLIRLAIAEVFGELDILYVPRLRLASRKVEEGDLQPLLEFILGLEGYPIKEAVNRVVSWKGEKKAR